MKRIFNLFKLIGIWSIQIGSFHPHYIFGISLITHARIYSINKQKLFPYLKLKRLFI